MRFSRHLIGPTKEKAVFLIVNDKMVCETIREKEAVCDMKIGKLLFIIIIV